ncbi:MAG: RDD family protein [Pseudomonadota bacterium]
MTDTAQPASKPIPDPAAPCGLGRRLLIMLYDFLPSLAIVFIAALIALPFTGDIVRLGSSPLYTLYILGAWFLYFGLCWTSSGQTLGMRAWKIEVIDDDGRRPSWGACTLRFATAIVSLLPAGLGYWSALLREDRACWHDRLSGTRLQRRERVKRGNAAPGDSAHSRSPDAGAID